MESVKFSVNVSKNKQFAHLISYLYFISVNNAFNLVQLAQLVVCLVLCSVVCSLIPWSGTFFHQLSVSGEGMNTNSG